MGTPISLAQFVLLGGGEILDYAAVASRIGEDDYIICADSGYDHCGALGVKPHLMVGDFDSVRKMPPRELPRLPFPAEKNYTDTSHAIEEALARGCRKLLLAGMTGGRLDHTLANLQCLAYLSRNGVDACITDGLTDIYAVTAASITLAPRDDFYFSLLALTETCTGVTITGAKYLLHEHTLSFDHPRAVSNEFLDETVTVSLRDGTLAVLLVPMD